MSYAHENMRLDRGYLTRLRERLEDQVSEFMGETVAIFQDTRDMAVGDHWEDHIKQALNDAAFLIPIITPHYFRSKWCRQEFELFRERERVTRQGPRIFPVYYVKCREMNPDVLYVPGTWEHTVRSYDYENWIKLKLFRIDSATVRRRVHAFAEKLHNTYVSIESNASAINLESSASTHAYSPVAISHSFPGTPFDLSILRRPQTVIGRGKDVAWASKNLLPGSAPRIVALNGAEGIGKTSVASEVIHRLHDDERFPGGIAVVVCTGMTNASTLLIHALIRFDPWHRPPEQESDAGLAEAAQLLLSGKQALIVFDDVDSRVDIARVVEPLKRVGASILLTSKARLSLAAAKHRTLTQLSNLAALNLFTQQIAERRQGDAEPN